VRGQRHTPAAFYPGKDPVPIVQEAGWATGLVWTGAENLAPTGIQSPDYPACSQSLHRLSYLTHTYNKYLKINSHLTENTQNLHYKDLLFDNITDIYYNDNTKHTNTLHGKHYSWWHVIGHYTGNTTKTSCTFMCFSQGT
jgi:hypothetical protein